MGLSTIFHHHMALVMHACEKLLLHYRVSWLKCMDNSCKIEGHYHGQIWTMLLLWRGIQTSHIHSWLSEICGGKAPTYSTTVFSWVWKFGSSIALDKVVWIRPWLGNSPLIHKVLIWKRHAHTGPTRPDAATLTRVDCQIFAALSHPPKEGTGNATETPLKPTTPPNKKNSELLLLRQSVTVIFSGTCMKYL